MEVFQDVLNKGRLERNDLELMIDHIKVYEGCLEIQLQAGVDAVNFKSGIENIALCRIVQSAAYQKDKIIDAHVISDGERQRISIARVLLKDVPVVLLDEATASLDIENESAVQTAFYCRMVALQSENSQWRLSCKEVKQNG